MIYIGTLRVAQKVAKETTKGIKYQVKAEDVDGNKITLVVEQSDFKTLSVGDVLGHDKLSWQEEIA